MPHKNEGNTTWRTTPRPAGWETIRQRILDRDQGVCYLCHQPGADAVDHIIAAHLGGSDDDDNLAAVHDRVEPHCHRRKTASEAGKAAARKRGTIRRPSERHPGLKADPDDDPPDMSDMTATGGDVPPRPERPTADGVRAVAPYGSGDLPGERSEPPELPERLRRFNPVEWDVGVGLVSHAELARANGAWKRARLAWAKEHGIPPKLLPRLAGPRPYPIPGKLYRG